MEDVLKEELKKALDQTGKTTSPQAKKKLQDTVSKIMEGKDPKEAMGMTPESEESLYAFGYDLFQSGKYWPAYGCFSFLYSLDPSSYRYLFGVASSCHYMQRYEEAAANYILCTELDRLNPVPYFHLYDCFLKLNYPESAFHALEMCIQLAELNPNYAPLKEKAKIESQGLQQLLLEKYGTKGEK